MASHIYPDSSSNGFPIALLVCIVVAVTIFVILSVIALRYYLLHRRHCKLRDRTPRSVTYIAPTNLKAKPSSQPYDRPRPPRHTHILTPPVLPQLPVHSPITSRPSIPVQPSHSVIPPPPAVPPPLKFSNSDREQNHLAVPISSFLQHREYVTRVPLHRLYSDLTVECDDSHKCGEDDDDGEREKREVVNRFFAAVVGKREREPNVQMGRWRMSTRERAILASDASTNSMTGTARNSIVEYLDKKPREDGRDSKGSRGSAREGGVERLSGAISQKGEGPLCLKGKWGPHGFVPAPLAVAKKDGLGERVLRGEGMGDGGTRE